MIERFLASGRVRRLAGWTLVGVMAVGGELGLLVLLRDGLGWPIWLASLVAGELAILARFLATDRFVFGHHRPEAGRLARYHGACAVAFGVSWGVLNGLVAWLAVPYQLAWVVGTALSLAVSAVSSFLWVWRVQSKAAPRRASAPDTATSSRSAFPAAGAERPLQG